MKISPGMVKETIEEIIYEELSFYLEDLLGMGTAVERCAVRLTKHAYFFAELPEPILKLPEIPRP
jgi:hypothetical protein